MFISFLLKSLISSENFTKGSCKYYLEGKQTCCLYFNLRPCGKQNEHKASKILRKISNFMTEGRQKEKYVQQAVVEWQKGLKLPNKLGF
jgi:hypothetical protein